MKLLAVIALAVGAVQALPEGKTGGKYCLTDAQAQAIVAAEATFLQHTDLTKARAAAMSIYQPGLNAYSDSINALYGNPLGQIVETSLDQYITETLSTPALQAVNTIDIVHDCTSVVWHWEFIGVGPQRIRGMTISKVDGSGKIYREDVEFNSLTWAQNTGWTVTPPPEGQYADPGSG